jgi:enoyl-CoA hydratase/carnithine racemase
MAYARGIDHLLAMSQPLKSRKSEIADGVLTLTLNRPDQRNSLTREMMSEISAKISAAGDDPDVRVVVLAANGPAFCAGHDLKELTAHRADPDGGRQFYEDTMRQCSGMMQSIVRCPKPVIARVHGIATAAGCQLVASCDLAVAADTASFATPGVNIGLFCSTPMVALSRNLSRKHAMEMLLFGEMQPAKRAEEIGLINKAVPEDELDAEVKKFAEKISQKSAVAIAIGKEAFYEQVENKLSDAYDYASDVMVRNMLAADAEEGIGAFLGKRQPKWSR